MPNLPGVCFSVLFPRLLAIHTSNPNDSMEQVLKRMKEETISRRPLENSGKWKESTQKIEINYEMCLTITDYEFNEEKLFSNVEENVIDLKVRIAKLKNEVLDDKEKIEILENVNKDSRIIKKIESDLIEAKKICKKHFESKTIYRSEDVKGGSKSK